MGHTQLATSTCQVDEETLLVSPEINRFNLFSILQKTVTHNQFNEN